MNSRCSPNERWLAVADGAYYVLEHNRVLLFDLDTGEQVGLLQPCRKPFELAWHPDSRTLTVSDWDSGTVHVCDSTSGKVLHTLREQKGGEPVVAMGFQGQLLTSSARWGSGRVLPRRVQVQSADNQCRQIHMQFQAHAL